MKINLNKKGFTLVELLAVIVVLAIIMLVVANRVGDAMKSSRGESLVLQVKSMEREIDKHCIVNNYITVDDIKNILKDSGLTYVGNVTNDGTTFNAQATKGSKFANIKVPNNASEINGTAGEDVLEPTVTINTSCPISITGVTSGGTSGGTQ